MKITHTVEIRRQPASVFSWLDDPAKATAWMSSVSRTEILHRTPDLVGTTFRETVADENGSTELQGMVTAYRPNQQIAFNLDGQFNAVAVEYRLEEVANGTRLTMRAEVHFKGTLKVLSFVMWPLFKRKVLDQFRRECATLKRLCESRPALADQLGAHERPPRVNGAQPKPTPRFWQIFFELYEGLPRQGPGNRACAERALGLCSELQPVPAVLDLGCGVGGQTLHLVELLPGAVITAIDSHTPSIERLRATAAEHGLSDRIRPLVGDMANPEMPPESFDLIWSEGALYQIGIENALRVCHGLLRPGGYLAFTDAVWLKENPPPEVKASFDLDYPTMGRVPDVLAAIDRTGFSLVDHFTLPDEAWCDDFYTPMERRIEVLRGKYAGDAEALAVLDQLAQEPEMHRRRSDYYAYEFFVARRPTGNTESGHE